jgi:hypothetical protein
MTNVLAHSQIERFSEQAVGHYGWLLLAALATLALSTRLWKNESV